MGKATSMRIDEKVRTALAVIVGEVQVETGAHKISVNDALWEFVKKHRPDIAQRAEQIAKDNDSKKE